MPKASDQDRRERTGGWFGPFAGVAGAIALVAAIVAAATIWLLLTDPVTVATSVDEGELSPLLKQLGEVIYEAIAALLRFL